MNNKYNGIYIALRILYIDPIVGVGIFKELGDLAMNYWVMIA